MMRTRSRRTCRRGRAMPEPTRCPGSVSCRRRHRTCNGVCACVFVCGRVCTCVLVCGGCSVSTCVRARVFFSVFACAHAFCYCACVCTCARARAHTQHCAVARKPIRPGPARPGPFRPGIHRGPDPSPQVRVHSGPGLAGAVGGGAPGAEPGGGSDFKFPPVSESSRRFDREGICQ